PLNHGGFPRAARPKRFFVIAIMAALPLMRHTVVDALVVGRTRATDVLALTWRIREVPPGYSVQSAAVGRRVPATSRSSSGRGADYCSRDGASLGPAGG